MLEGSNIFSIFNSKKINRIFIIYYIFFLLPIFCTIVIPIKYVEDSSQSVNTPREIMTYYMKQKINIKLEIGTPKQEIEIPLGFSVSDFYIVDKTHLRTSTIKNKLFDDKKSSSFNIISGDNLEYYFNDDYSTYQDGYDTLYFLNEFGKSDYSDIKMDFRFAYLTSTDDPGRFGLQIYSKDEDDRKVPCPLRMLYQNKMSANYVWSIHFNRRENILGDENEDIMSKENRPQNENNPENKPENEKKNLKSPLIDPLETKTPLNAKSDKTDIDIMAEAYDKAKEKDYINTTNARPRRNINQIRQRPLNFRGGFGRGRGFHNRGRGRGRGGERGRGRGFERGRRRGRINYRRRRINSRSRSRSGSRSHSN